MDEIKIKMEIKNLISNKGNVINDLLIINPKVFEDNEVTSMRAEPIPFNKSLGKEITFLQDNHYHQILEYYDYITKPKIIHKENL